MAEHSEFTLEGTSRRPRAVIAGGGLAGLACAKRLVDAGFQVELVEAEEQLGGRCANWTDKDGTDIESGVHTFFGVYSHLIRLLNEIGVDDDRMVSWDDKIGFLLPDARLSIFTFDPIRDLPNVIAGLLGNNQLVGPVDKLMLGFTFLNGLLRREDYEHRTVAQLATDGGMNRETFERVIRPLSRGLAFAEPEELSAWVLLTLLTHGIMNPWNLRAGTFRGGMTDRMAAPIGRWLVRQGAVVRTKSALKTIHYEGAGSHTPGRISGFELESGERLTGDVYVSALPLEVIKEKIPQGLQDLTYFQNIRQIQHVPAISVQLWFDRSFVSRDEFIYMAGSPMIVFQDESRLVFPHPGSRISAQITDRMKDGYSDQQYIDLALEELHRYIPASARATLQKAVVIRHAAILIKPGTHALRPEQASPVSNFFLAGDYTRQDWFTTMEGATRSGEMAARRVLRRMGYRVDEDDELSNVAAAAGVRGLRSNLGNAVRSGIGRSTSLAQTIIPRATRPRRNPAAAFNRYRPNLDD